MVPSQDYSQGSPEPRAISEFNDFLKKKELQSHIKPQKTFVCLAAVKDYLGKHQPSRLGALLDALYPDEDNNHVTEEISTDYTAILCILMKINKGHHIKSFVEAECIDDKHLPFTQLTKPIDFPVDSKDAEFYDDFCKAQWAFLPLPFTKNMGKTLDNQRILPITLMEARGSGGSGSVSRIEIHGCYNLIRPKEPGDYPCTSNKLLDTFALKTYYESGSESSKWEVEAYQKLSDCSQITKYYGYFTHNDIKYVLLEFADKGSLEKYFNDTPPPSTPEDINAFWRSLFDITKALYRVHSHNAIVGGRSEKEVGWHYDVKPDNILVFGDQEKDSPYNCLFKLTDFGLSMFEMTNGKLTDPVAPEGGGTTTYAAPECFKHDQDWGDTPILTSPNVDIWSFACIISEAIVWMGMNCQGLREYRMARLNHHLASRNPRLGDCFHDGKKGLGLVREWHRKAMPSLRNCDRITVKVAEIIEESVLYKNPQLMSNAKQLSFMFFEALERAEQSSEEAIPSSPSSPSSGTQAMPFVVPAPQMALPWCSKPDEGAKADDVEAYEVEEIKKISGLQTRLETLLDEADDNLEKGDATMAGKTYEKARDIWKENFSSLPGELLQHQLRIYLGEVRVLTERGKSLKGTSRKHNLDNTNWFRKRADIIQKILVLMRKMEVME